MIKNIIPTSTQRKFYQNSYLRLFCLEWDLYVWRAIALLSAVLTLACAPGGPSTTFSAEEASEESSQSPDEPEFSLTLFSDATGITMTNATALGTEPANNVSRAAVSLPQASQVRAHFASSLTWTTIRLRIEYSLNAGTSWTTLVPEFAASSSANANSTSDWSNIPEEAKTTVLLRALILGDGVLDPVIRYIRLGYR